jgi:hypothetical protein
VSTLWWDEEEGRGEAAEAGGVVGVFDVEEVFDGVDGGSVVGYLG